MTETCVERDRLRERERQARAQRAQMASQDRTNDAPLFGAIFKVKPSAEDPVTQQIQNQLGHYELVKPLLEDSKRTAGLLGSDGIPPSPAPVSNSSRLMMDFKRPSSSMACNTSGSSSSSSHSQNRSTHHHQHPPTSRGGFIKPADGKPGYGGRGSYPVHPVKHGTGSRDHRASSGIGPPKGPPHGHPQANVNSSSAHYRSSVSSSHPIRNANSLRLNVGHSNRDLSVGSDDLPSGPTSNNNHADVDNILKEMAELRKFVPLDELTATPRVDLDTKFSFPPIFEKISVAPPPKPISPPPPTPAPVVMHSPTMSTPPKNQTKLIKNLKSLRDNYRLELKRTNSFERSETGSYLFKRQWTLLEQTSVDDVLCPAPSSRGISPTPNRDTSELSVPGRDEEENITTVVNDTLCSDRNLNIVTNEVPVTYPSMSMPNITSPDTSFCRSQTSEKRLKRKREEKLYLPKEKEKLDILKRESELKMDGDYYFLLSYLPIMKEMNNFQKLQFRMKMSEVVLQIKSGSRPVSSSYFSDCSTDKSAVSATRVTNQEINKQENNSENNKITFKKQ